MRTKLTAALSLIVLILCTGCPYESKYSLKGKEIEYNPNLIGVWKADKIDLRISQTNSKTFQYDYDDHDDMGVGKVKGTGYVVSNQDVEYIVAELTKEENSQPYKVYITYKIQTIDKNSFTVVPLESENVEMSKKTFKSAAAFSKYVFKDDEAFKYTKALTFIRQ